jgi:hypothetical protein
MLGSRRAASYVIDRDLGVLARGPAAMFAVLMILAITTIVGALRSDIRGGSGRRRHRGVAQPSAAVIRSSSSTRRVR